ncbi:MAG: hypothetical protein FWD04_08165 [Conexibacteraceae bacterium]|nr:hypothetical protein [Conexibacteraceae bacterium]
MSERITLTEPLEDWCVTLTSGDVVRVWAHGYSRENGDYVFSFLAAVRPHSFIEVARFPKTAVAKIRSA